MRSEFEYSGPYEDYSERERYDLAMILTDGAKRCGDDPRHWRHAAELLEDAMHLMATDETLKSYVEYSTEIGAFLMQDGDFGEAISYLESVSKYVSDPDIQLDLGVCYAQQNEALKAVKAWSRALEFSDEHQEDYQETIEALAGNIRIVSKACGINMRIHNKSASIQKAIQSILENLTAG